MNAIARKVSRDIRRDVTVRIPKIQERAAVGAANKATRKVYTQTIRDLSKETGIKQQVLRGSKKKGVRGRVQHFKYTRRSGQARVWVGLGDIPLIKVFNGKRIRTGAAKYTKYTAGSMDGRTSGEVFAAKMPNGHEGFFVRRPGVGRLGIQEVKLDIEAVGNRVVKLNGKRIGGPEFQREYSRDLRRRLKKL